MRWKNHLKSLSIRHDILVHEMRLRGFNHKSPVCSGPGDIVWPEIFINPPHEQYELLREKYSGKKKGRIPLPKNSQNLWACHKYSVMARDIQLYKKIGKDVSDNKIPFDMLCRTLVLTLRNPPELKKILNAVDHMWGYISDYAVIKHDESDWKEIFREVQKQAFEQNVSYLMHSTALGELKFWYHHHTKNNNI